jgi:hypothetical protein
MDVQTFIIDMRGYLGGFCLGEVGMASLFLDENKPVVNVMDKKGIVDSQVTFGSGIDLGKSTGSAGQLYYRPMESESFNPFWNYQMTMEACCHNSGLYYIIRQVSNVRCYSVLNTLGMHA